MWIPFSNRPSFVVRRKKSNVAENKGMINGGGYFLSEPSTDKVNGFNIILDSMEVGHSSMQGYRPNMEDECIAVVMKDLPDHVIVAILDGHAGGGASKYVSQNLPLVIAETSQYKEYVQLSKKKRAESIELLSAALVQAYVDVDEQFFSYESMVRITCTWSTFRYYSNLLTFPNLIPNFHHNYLLQLQRMDLDLLLFLQSSALLI
jgi:hypothetical protein